MTALLVSNAGCDSRPALPKTYPVTGQVLYKGGGPVPGGTVQFQSQKDASLTISGEIQPDGGFSLHTLVGAEKLKGAVEGPHRVIIIPPMAEDQQVEPVTLPRLYTIEPRENHFTFEIERRRTPTPR